MQYLGIEAALKNQPLLDPAFIPFGVWRREYEKEASRPFALAVERDHGAVSVFETKLRGEDFAEANYRYIERFVKLLLWSAGGLRVWLCGDDALAKRLQAEYCPDGRRAFDVGFMQDVFEVPFEIVICDWAHLPKPNEKPIRVGGHTNGCRIGFPDDIEFENCTAKICRLIVYGKARFFGLFGREEDICIKWCDIEVIGEDTILVSCQEPSNSPKKRGKLFGNLLK